MRLNIFSQMHSDLKADAYIAYSRSGFESSAVKATLRLVGAGISPNDLMRRSGKNVLTFDLFNQEFPTFPFYLVASRLRGISLASKKTTSTYYDVHTDPASTEPRRFKDFENVPFVVAYRQFSSGAVEAGESRPVAMVFPRKGLPSGMVIYRDDSMTYAGSGTVWMHVNLAQTERLFVRPYADFLELIAQTNIMKG